MPTQQRRKSAAAINKLWVQVMGLELFNEAQRKVPVQTGKLKNSGVRKHKKTYKKYYKPTLTPKGWAAINYQSKSDVEGIKWVQKAWTKVRNRQPRDIRNELPKNLVISKSNLQNVV